MSKLKEAKQRYKTGTEFYTATGNIKYPLTVTSLRYANHADRLEQIKNLEDEVLTEYNSFIFPKIEQQYKKIQFTRPFLKLVVGQMKELKYLLSLEKDIVDRNMGVIYDSTTDKWAKTN